MQLMFIGDLSDVFVGIIMVLDSFIYTMITSAYKIFMALASARLLSSDVYYEVANRLYLVVGVVMLFVLSYAILKAIVNPDEMSKGDLGNGMVKRVLIAVIGLAITPVLFNVLYQAQGLFLEQDVLGKIFFRIQNTEEIDVSGSSTSTSVNPDEEIENVGGAVASSSIWYAVFHPEDGYDASEIKADASDYLGVAAGHAVLCGLGIAAGVIISGATWGWGTALGVGAAVYACGRFVIAEDIETYNELSALSSKEISLEDAYGIVAGGGDFDIFLIFMDNYFDNEIKYLWGLSTICGAFALYAFVSFSIDMGVRAAKLAYYQIIAPVPLTMQVLPKYKDTFGKYVKNVVSTFLEVFIRISVVYIVTFVICHITEYFSTGTALWGSTNLNDLEKAFAVMLLILGLILFAKSAPDVICQSLNIEKGSMSLGLRKKLGEGGYYAAKDIGKSGVRNALARGRAAYSDPNKKGFARAMSAVGAGMKGFGLGVGQNAYDQFFRPGGGKMSMNNMDIRDHQARVDAKLDQAYQTGVDNANELAAARKNQDFAEKVYRDALATGDSVKIAEAKRNLEVARERLEKATALGRHLDEAAKKFDAWTTISVSLEVEEADIKFSNALKKLKDDVRAEALKKSLIAQGHEKNMADLKAQPISEYREGWDENSFNEELRRRLNQRTLDEINKDSRVSAALGIRQKAEDDLASAERALILAEQSGDVTKKAAALNARDLARNKLSVASRDLATIQEAVRAELEASGTLESVREAVTTDFTNIAKKSERELTAERVEVQRKIKIEKDLMESALDDWVAENASSDDIRGILQPFLNQHSEYISKNASRIVFDGNTVMDMISDFSDVHQKYDPSHAGEQRSFVFTDAHDNKVTYTYNSATREYESSDASEGSMDIEELFNFVKKKLNSDRGSKFEADTAVTRSSKKGKKAAEGIPLTQEYIDKVKRKRQMDDAKSGKK